MERAARGRMPALVAFEISVEIFTPIRRRATASNTIEQMAAAARMKGYEYIGITDHSQSLKIARGVSGEDLWKQIRFIDELNGGLARSGF